MKDIVIIGGGISGLYTALKLHGNKDVTLFEQSNIYGGKVYTDSFSIDNVKYSLEAGAGRILSTHNLMLDLIQNMNLKNLLIEINSKVEFSPSKYYTLKNMFQDKTGFDFIDKIIQYSKNHTNEELKNMTFKEYASIYLTDNELKFMLDSTGYYGDIVAQNAYNAIDVFKTSIRTDKKYYIMKNGFSTLIDRMVYHVKKKHKCYNGKSCNKIFYNDGIFTLDISGIRVFCKKLVLAIPKNSLLNFNILKPYFPLLKSVETLRLIRIYSIYDSNDIWFKNINKTTTNSKLSYIIPINKDTGVIMTSYTDYKKADYWSEVKKNKKVLSDTLDKQIENTFGIKPKKPKDIKLYEWSNGVAVWKKNTNSSYLIKKISNPDTNIKMFIVGENYSKYQGWMEGALESVNRIISNFY